MLNEKQKKASEKLDWALLIVAWAGSWKTKTLTHRIANLLKSWVKPWEIVAVTFTNKAGFEMRERVQNLLSLEWEYSDIPFIWTFHSFCLRILRTEIEKIWFKSNFTIYDSKDQINAIKICFQKMELDLKKENAKTQLSKISNYKNIHQWPKQVLALYWNSDKKTAEIYKEYQNLLKENNAVDFDDIMNFTVDILENFPEIKEKYWNRYKYICVDEYQDTNFVQYKLIKLLWEKHWNVCVIWDWDQSIYSFRWADIRNILEFEKDFKPCEVVKLEQNYRSTQTILKAADQIISNNFWRQKKTMRSELWEWEKITVAQLNWEKQEAEFIAEEISDKMRKDLTAKLSDFAVLYRTNAQSRAIEESLVKNWIWYKIIWWLKFYDRKEVKDVLAYLKLIHSPVDSISMLRIINVPTRKIWKTSIWKLQSYAWQRNLGLWEMVRHIETVEWLSTWAKKSIKNFSDIIEKLREKQKEIYLSNFIDLVLSESWYLAMLEKENTIENKSRLENLEELKSVAMKFDELWEEWLWRFLEEVALVADTDSIDDWNQVLLMTLHSSKWLEFENVFMVWAEEWIFPSSRSLDEDGGIDEERRLMYVWVTRAKQKLFLTHTKSRLLYWEFKNNPPSRFLWEISQELIEEIDKTFQENSYKNSYWNFNSNFKKPEKKWWMD